MNATGRFARLAFPLLLFLSALACTLGSPTPTRAPLPDTPTRAPSGLIDAPLGGAAVAVTPPAGSPPFARYGPVESDVDGELGWLGLPELADLANPADLWPLNDAQRARLEEIGFVVVPEPAPASEIYAEAAEDGRPLFLTADLVLQATMGYFAAAWREQALPQLADDLAALVRTMRQVAEVQFEQLEGAEDPAGRSLAEAARRNLAYLTVAQRLLEPAAEPHPAVAGTVADEWTLVMQADGVFASPISGARVDYRPFGRVPAGAAADDPLLPTYRVFQWFHQQPLPLSGSPGEVRRRAQRVLLYLLALEQSQNRARWDRLDGGLSYLWDGGHPFSPAEAETVADGVFGQIPDSAAMTGVEELDSFVRTADGLGFREFRFFHVGDGPVTDDAAILNGLTFNRVGGYLEPVPDPLPFTAADTAVGVIRSVPRVLDVAAVHGSEQARRILEAGGDTAYESFGTQFEQLRAEVENRPVSRWAATFSGGWHYALLPLLAPPLAAGPAFMRDDAWDRSRLYAWQAAWSTGRWTSDTESVQLEQDIPQVGVYLEPQPILYARLAALTRQQAAGLTARGLIAEEESERLTDLADLLDGLSAISADQRQSTFRQPGNDPRLRQALAILIGVRLSLPHVVDVYEASTGRRMLQSAVGGFYPIYVTAPWDEEHRVFTGAVWASFEVVRDVEERLIAAEWETLDLDEWPDRPGWSNPFIVQ